MIKKSRPLYGLPTRILLAYTFELIQCVRLTQCNKLMAAFLSGILITLTVSCQKKAISDERSEKLQQLVLDTIPEITNPDFLDLSVHQVFIDTTRSSLFYRNLQNWTPSKSDITEIQSRLRQHSKNFSAKKVQLLEFPKTWISIKRFQENFFLYERCDGIDPRYEIADSAFITYGPLEPDVEPIVELLNQSDHNIVFRVRSSNPTDSTISSVTIAKTKIPNIYSLLRNNDSSSQLYLIPSNKISEFDLLVNHCPEQKVIEFQGFQ